ncbi:MAG: redoxin domain-containing protein [Gemmatimonadota bacterium]|nr:redoxin domain-containing protein [Gemmatimonadota bacterium]
MEAYRDQYAKYFNGGRKVVVLAVSTDPDSALYSWARDADFPMLFGSDSGEVVGKLYGAETGRNYDRRYLFVIGPDGRIAYRVVGNGFNVLSSQAYQDMQAAVYRAAGVDEPGSQ